MNRSIDNLQTMFSSPRKISSILGFVVVTLWTCWWIGSLLEDPPRLLFANASWLPAWNFLGLDLMHNHLGARAWLQGINPYLQDFGDPRGLYTYPPVVLPFFAWAAFIPDSRVATGLWAIFIATTCLFCLKDIQAFRHNRGLVDMPLLAMLALVLWSSPVVFAMERGNCDVLVLIFVLFAARLLNRPTRWQSDFFAAASLSIAVAVKVYPLVAALALLALKRTRVLAFLGLCMMLIVLFSAEGWQQWLTVMKSLQGSQVDIVSQIFRWADGDVSWISKKSLSVYTLSTMWGSLHSPGNWWPALWLSLGSESIASWPLLIVQLFTLAPVALLGCWQIFRMQDPSQMSLPVLLWILVLATFAMPTSWDYNLIYLPLLMVTLWDRRDPWWVHVLFLMSVPWWIPFGPSGFAWALARVLLKLFALYFVTIQLASRLHEVRYSQDLPKTSTERINENHANHSLIFRPSR